jgi:hypothetical protein
MKLRIKGNSLRLRVSPSEMARLLDTGRIEETIYFAAGDGAKLTYALEHRAAEEISLHYRANEVTVSLSTASVHEWAEGEQVGIYGALDVGHGQLELIVEKDFACLDGSDAENADTFANPNQGAVC